MNTLSVRKRTEILSLLTEGTSMRAVERLTGRSINTIARTLIAAGKACAAYQAAHIRNINAKHIQCDEIWAFCQKKQKHVELEHEGVLGYGSVWSWVSLDADSKLVISWLVGLRTAEYAEMFVSDLASRLSDRIQLTSDGFTPYLTAVEKVFGGLVDFGMLVKSYDARSRFVDAEKRIITGSPDFDKISTSYVERLNLTLRMQNRRFTRRTNAFSKKIENLEHSLALHFMHYNFARIHKTLRVTPAMEAGLSDHVWSIEEIAALIPEPVATKRGPYKKRVQAADISK